MFWSPEGFLTDPQQQDSYSYARNNPITLSDPSGQCIDGVTTLVCVAAIVFLSTIVAAHAAMLYGAITHNVKIGEAGFAFNNAAVIGASGMTIPEQTNPFTAEKNEPLQVIKEVSDSKDEIYLRNSIPKSPKNFIIPTNAPQLPPTEVPDGYTVRVMGPTKDYPNGYWRMFNGQQAIDPSIMKTPNTKTSEEFEARTHIPLPSPTTNAGSW